MLSRKAVLFVILLFASTLVITANAQTAAPSKGTHAPEKVIAIHAANLIDGVSNQVRHDVLVVIKGNKIESVTSGYPLEGYNPDIVVPKGAQLGDGPVELRKITRQQLENGADWIKVYMTHRSWVDKEGHLVSQPTLTVEELKAVVDEAHGQQKRVACHAYSGIGLHRALDGGCDSIEHGLSLDNAAIAQMKKQGTWFVPTLTVYYLDWSPENTPEGKRDRARANEHEVSFKKALKAGIKIAYGTDMGGIPWTEP